MRIIKKKYEYCQQMFVDFRKAYESIYRNSLYNIKQLKKKILGRIRGLVTENDTGSSTNQKLKEQLKIITVNKFIKS